METTTPQTQTFPAGDWTPLCGTTFDICDGDCVDSPTGACRLIALHTHGMGEYTVLSVKGRLILYYAGFVDRYVSIGDTEEFNPTRGVEHFPNPIIRLKGQRFTAWLERFCMTPLYEYGDAAPKGGN